MFHNKLDLISSYSADNDTLFSCAYQHFTAAYAPQFLYWCRIHGLDIDLTNRAYDRARAATLETGRYIGQTESGSQHQRCLSEFESGSVKFLAIALPC